MRSASEFINLLYLSMIDQLIVNKLDRLNLPQPIIDESFYVNRRIAIRGENTVGLDFVFKEIGGISENGIPSLSAISFYSNCNLTFPNDVVMSDSNEDIVKKIGGEAPFRNKLLKKSRIWLLTGNDGKKFNFSVNFDDIELTSIRGIAVSVSSDNDVKYWVHLSGDKK